MSKTEGEILTCDICGESVFLGYTGDKEADGGYTRWRWREYEKPPEGWNSAKVLGIGIGDTCPACSERINEAISAAIAELGGQERQ